MLNVPTSKIQKKLAALQKRFNYQNNRFAKEFQEHEKQLKKLKALIESKHNEVLERSDEIMLELKRIDTEQSSIIASIKRLEGK